MLNDMLTGRRIIKVSDVVRICPILGVDANYLLELRKVSEDLIISDKEHREIQIITEDDELIVSITDEDIIVKDGYKVVCVPSDN